MLRPLALLALGLGLALAACAQRTAPAAPASGRGTLTPMPATPTTDLAPFPYSVEQLRAGCSTGRVLRYRLVDSGHAIETEMRFVASTEESATIETSIKDEKGTLLGAPKRDTTKWADLMHHASFPAATTSIEAAEVDTPAGHFAASKYVVRRPSEDGRPSVAIFYFDKAKGGPPVRMLVEVAGAIAQEMTMLGDTREGAAP